MGLVLWFRVVCACARSPLGHWPALVESYVMYDRSCGESRIIECDEAHKVEVPTGAT